MINPGGGDYVAGGGNKVSGSELNTNTGNELTHVPIVAWKSLGATGVNLTLYHNSVPTYGGDFGEKWSSSYDVSIDFTSGTTALLHRADGLILPYAYAASVFTTPAGFYNALVHHGGGTWTLTEKDGSYADFDASGYMASTSDRNGNTITIHRNGSHQVDLVTDGSGRTVTIHYGANSKVDTVTDEIGRLWTFIYDGNLDLRHIDYPALSAVIKKRYFTYNAAHCILTEIDLNNKTWTSTYDGSQRLTSSTDPTSRMWGFAYSTNYLTMTLPDNVHTVVDNYSGGLLTSRVDELGQSVAINTRDGNANITQLHDKNGFVWNYTWDSSGNMLTAVNPYSKTATMTYNGFSEPLTIEDENHNTTTLAYYGCGDLQTVTNPLTYAVANYTYDGNHQLDGNTDATSVVTSCTYDADGNMDTSTDSSSVTTTYGYDGIGRLTTKTWGGYTETIAYDEWERPTRLTHGADSTHVDMTYDFENRVLTGADENGHAQTLAYDDAGRILTTANANSETITNTFDTNGRLDTVTDANSNMKTYTRNDRGQVIQLDYPDSTHEYWDYDNAGNCNSYTNGIGTNILYEYDDAGRQSKVDYTSGTDTDFSYDDAGNLTQMDDSSGTSTWTPDAANQITALGTPQGNFTYTFDHQGRRLTMVDGAATTTYHYDATTGKPDYETNPVPETTTWHYDALGRLDKQTFDSTAHDDYAYDSRQRLYTLTHKNSSNATLSDEVYTYDPASNLTEKIVGTTKKTDYSYDNADQLLTESNLTLIHGNWIAMSSNNWTYSYDLNGNRLTKQALSQAYPDVYRYDVADQLLDIKNNGSTVKSFVYNNDGSRASMTAGANTTTYSYDFDVRLTGITYQNTTTNSFSYNGVDARVGMVNAAASTFTYRRDGVDATDNVMADGVATYTPGVSERRSSTTKFYAGNYQGTNNVEEGTGQTITATKTYDAFGIKISSTGSSASPFGFAGGWGYQEDPDSGLKLLGHRYYDPSIGRFLTRDTAKEGRNWYVYCSNKPISRVDPTGLGWHNPACVHISPDFPGEVYVVGEPYPSTDDQVIVKLKHGQRSHPSMDVDLVVVVHANGAKEAYFLMGWGYFADNPYVGEDYQIAPNGDIRGRNIWQIDPSGNWGWPESQWHDDIERAKRRPLPMNRAAQPDGAPPFWMR